MVNHDGYLILCCRSLEARPGADGAAVRRIGHHLNNRVNIWPWRALWSRGGASLLGDREC